jgi:glutamyl/glutaminyl-tRNA synthetase
MTLADARLAVVNATLADALGGELILVGPPGVPRHGLAGNLELLAWLGLEWTERRLDEPPVDADIAGLVDGIALQHCERDAIRQIAEDRALGITHVVLPLDHRDIAALAERIRASSGRQLPVYLLVGVGEPPSNDAATALAWYRERGYLPEGLEAYLAASACWPTPPASIDTSRMQACYRRRELSHAAWSPDGEQIHRAGRQAMRAADPERVRHLLRARFRRLYGRWHGASTTSHLPEEWLSVLASALQEEAGSLDEAAELARFAFVDRVGRMTGEVADALNGPHVCAVLAGCREGLDPGKLATPDRAKLFFQELRHHFRDTVGLRGRDVMFPIRAALTGTMVGPCLGVVASLLGYERCRGRLREALTGLQYEARDKA